MLNNPPDAKVSSGPSNVALFTLTSSEITELFQSLVSAALKMSGIQPRTFGNKVCTLPVNHNPIQYLSLMHLPLTATVKENMVMVPKALCIY